MRRVLRRVREVPAVWRTSAGQAAINAGIWAVVARLLGGAGRTLRSLVLARLLAPADFGLAAIAVIAIETLDACTATGLESALVQQKVHHPEDLDRVFTTQLVRGILIGIVAWSLAGTVAAWVDADRLAPVMRWLSLIPVLRGFSNPGVVLLVRQLEFRRLFVWETADTVAALGIGIAVALSRPDVTALVAAFLAGQLVRSALSWGITRQWPKPRGDIRRSAELFRFGRWVLAANVLMLANVHGEHVVVAALFGTAALGLYQMAARIAELPIVLFAHPLLQAGFPALAAVRDDRRAFVDLWVSLAAALLAVSLGWAAIALAFAPALISLVLGERWAAAAPILRIVAVTTVLRALVVAGQPAFYALGHPELHVRVNTVRLVAIGLLLPVGAAASGLLGIAGAILGGTAAAAMMQLALLRRALAGTTFAGHE